MCINQLTTRYFIYAQNLYNVLGPPCMPQNCLTAYPPLPPSLGPAHPPPIAAVASLPLCPCPLTYQPAPLSVFDYRSSILTPLDYAPPPVYGPVNPVDYPPIPDEPGAPSLGGYTGPAPTNIQTPPVRQLNYQPSPYAPFPINEYRPSVLNLALPSLPSQTLPQSPLNYKLPLPSSLAPCSSGYYLAPGPLPAFPAPLPVSSPSQLSACLPAYPSPVSGTVLPSPLSSPTFSQPPYSTFVFGSRKMKKNIFKSKNFF